MARPAGRKAGSFNLLKCKEKPYSSAVVSLRGVPVWNTHGDVMARILRRNGVYYYRARVPADIREQCGFTEFRWTLRTRNRSHALVLSAELSIQQLRVCEAIREHGAMTEDQIESIVEHHLRSFWKNREQDAIQFGPMSADMTEHRRQSVAARLEQAETDLAANDLKAVEQLATSLAFDLGLAVDQKADGFRLLCYRLLQAQVELFRKDARQLLPAGVSAPRQPIPAPVVAPASPLLSELVTTYMRERDIKAPFRPKTRGDVVNALGTMIDLLGDRELASVRNKDAQEYALKLSQLPNRWRQAHKGKAASEVLRLTQGQDVPRIEPATINKEVALVKSFWAWACLREERQNNPLLAVKPLDVGNEKDKRKPFSDDELKQLAPAIEKQRLERPDRYWVATLLAWTGARLEEIAQLRRQDVITESGVVCIRITDEAGSVKGGAGSASERIVPVHSAVLAKGFLQYVKESTGERLWFGDKDQDRYGDAISKWFGYTLTGLKFDDRKRKTLHSFRHTMRDRLLRAGVDGVTRREILGHAHEDVEDQVYGDPTGVLEKQAALERVKLPI